MKNGDFEDGLSPYWFAFANSNSMTVQLNTTDRGYSALNSGRTAVWQGVSQDLDPSCMQKAKYTISSHAKIAADSPLSSDNYKLTMRITDTNGVKKYKTVQGSINDNDWSFISGTINLSDIDGDIADVRIYAHGADLSTSYLVDDVSAMLLVTEAPSISPSKIPTGAPTTCFDANDGGRTGLDGYYSEDVLYNAVRSYRNQACRANQGNCGIAQVYGYPINSWCVGSVTDMSFLFYHETDFNEDINGWDTSSVTSMRGTFIGARSFNQTLSSWNTSQVTTMSSM